MKFRAFGHPHISAKHATTLEFTKDTELTPKGDCIVGVNADYSLDEVKKLLTKETLTLIIEVDGMKEEIHFTPNKIFDDAHEMVIRTTDFVSERTLGMGAEKASKDLSRELIKKCQDPKQEIKVTIQ